MLPTPVSGALFALENIEGVKEGCEGDVKSEILAGEDWTRSCSPPLTPGECKFHLFCGRFCVAERMMVRTGCEKLKKVSVEKIPKSKITVE